MHALMPAEVHIGPSFTKILSSSSSMSGYSFFNSWPSAQCVVTRRPASRPAAAAMKAPVHRQAVRRARGLARRSAASNSGSAGFTTVGPAMSSVS